MNKKEFLKELDIKLSLLDYEVKKDILYDYEEHFRIALFEGKTEEEICADLGNPNEIAQTYLTENYNVSAEQITQIKELPINNQRKSEAPQINSASSVQYRTLGVSIKDISYNRLNIQDTDNTSVSVRFLEDNGNLFFCEQKGDVLHIRKKHDKNDLSGIINIYVPKGMTLESLIISDCCGNVMIKSTQINRCEMSVNESDIVFDSVNINYISLETSEGNTKMFNSTFNTIKYDSSDGNFEMNSSNSNSISADMSCGNISLTSVTAIRMSVDASDGNIAVNSCSIPDVTLDLSDGDCAVGSCTMNNLNVDTSDGNVNITNSNMNKLDVDSSDGNIHLAKVNAPYVKIDSSDGNISLSDIIGSYIEIDTSDGDIHISNCVSNICKMDSSDGNISATSCDCNELNVSSSDGDINLNIGEIGSLKCDSSDGNVKVNITKSYNSVEIENCDGDVVLNVPWEISFSGHIDIDEGDFNTKLPLVHDNGDIRYSSQRQKESRIIVNNNDGNVYIGYSNKEGKKDSEFGVHLSKEINELVDTFKNFNFSKENKNEPGFKALLSNEIHEMVDSLKNFDFNIKIPEIPPIPNININIPGFYSNQSSNQKNYTSLNYNAKEWIKNPDIPDNAAIITSVTSPEGVGIQKAYRLSGAQQGIGEIMYDASGLEKNTSYAITFWIKNDEAQTITLQAEIIFDGDHDNKDIFELSLISPVKTNNNWKQYELFFETGEHEAIQFRLSAMGNAVFFTN